MGRPKAAERLVGVGGKDGCLLLGLQALADPVRLEMVRLLGEREQCVCHLSEAFGLSQASISHHMGILKRAGLVEDRRDTRWTYYRLSTEAIAALRQAVDALLEVGPKAMTSTSCCDPLEGAALSTEPNAAGTPIPIEMISIEMTACSDSPNPPGTQSPKSQRRCS